MAKKTRTSKKKTSSGSSPRSSAKASRGTSKKTRSTKKAPAGKKTAGRSSTAKKTARKTARTSTAKKAAKKTGKPVGKKKSAGKAAKAAKKSRSAPAQAAPAQPKAAAKTPDKPQTPPPAAPNKGPQGRDSRPPRRASKPQPPARMPKLGEGLLAPGIARKPLIPSGPTNVPEAGAAGSQSPSDEKTGKSPFTKRQLEKYRTILLRKRAELIGDVSEMEREALLGGSTSLSHVPQHLADQGSDAYDQSLSLDLAAADRRLIKEIDEALRRIADGTFGLCQLTGKPIRPERLEELPWAKHSIEAARELERRSHRP